MSSKRYFAIKSKRNKNKAKSLNKLDNSIIKTKFYNETDYKKIEEMYDYMIKRLKHPYLAEINLIKKEYSEIDQSKFSKSKLFMKQINYLENEINNKIMFNNVLYNGKHINYDKYEMILNEMNLLMDTLEQMKRRCLRTSFKTNNASRND